MCFGFANQSHFFLYKLTSGLSSLSFSLPAAAPSMLSPLLVGAWLSYLWNVLIANFQSNSHPNQEKSHQSENWKVTEVSSTLQLDGD